MFSKRKKVKIGLALGSGGLRGLAHIGIIKALEKNNISIDFIAGSSAGALIGGFYAAKKDIKEIEKLVLSTNKKQILSLFFYPSIRKGLIRTKKLKKTINKHLGKITFSGLKIPFKAVATDLKIGKTVILDRGDVSSAIEASCALPLLFRPVLKDKKILVDGGISMPVPVDVVRKMGANFVIAVNLYKDEYIVEKNKKLKIYSIANNSAVIFAHHLAKENIKNADFVISPNIENIRWRDILKEKSKKNIILTNEKLMEKIIPQLKKLIEKKQKQLLD